MGEATSLLLNGICIEDRLESWQYVIFMNADFFMRDTMDELPDFSDGAREIFTPPAPTLDPAGVTINDANLVASSVAGGTATGTIAIDAAALPAGVTASVSGSTITVTGVRPPHGQPAIVGEYVILVTRGGAEAELTVTINLTPLPPTVEVNAITVNDTNLVVSAPVGGSATGTITMDASTLPAGVTAVIDQGTGAITVTGVRPPHAQPAIIGTFNVSVTREGVTTNLVVNVNLSPLEGTLSPDAVEVNDDNLVVSSTVEGTAVGEIGLNTANLPAGVTATVNQATGVITVTGVRPATGQPAIVGTFIVPVTRGGLTANLSVVVNLTPQSMLPNEPGGEWLDSTGVSWCVLVPASSTVGGVGNALIITTHVHQIVPNQGVQYFTSNQFRLFEASTLRNTMTSWYNNNANVSPELRAMGLNYTFQNNANRGAAGAGIEVNTATGSTTGPWMSNADRTAANAARATTLPTGNAGSGEVFVLSATEVNRYMPQITGSACNTRQAQLHHAQATNGGWWLRSPGAITGSVGNLNSSGNHANSGANALSTVRGFRAALWVQQ